jgi:hypothetical protein
MKEVFVVFITILCLYLSDWEVGWIGFIISKMVIVEKKGNCVDMQ